MFAIQAIGMVGIRPMVIGSSGKVILALPEVIELCHLQYFFLQNTNEIIPQLTIHRIILKAKGLGILAIGAIDFTRKGIVFQLETGHCAFRLHRAGLDFFLSFFVI
jgi:hypothetical protein